MSKLTIGLSLGFVALWAAFAAGKGMSPYAPALALAQGCEAGEIGRAGGLIYLPRQNAWISARGAVFRLAGCPSIRGL